MPSAKVARPPERRCENCGFWEPLGEPGDAIHKGQCVRHPPVWCGERDGDGLLRFEWPVTGVYATCGDWAREDGRYRMRWPE